MKCYEPAYVLVKSQKITWENKVIANGKLSRPIKRKLDLTPLFQSIIEDFNFK